MQYSAPESNVYVLVNVAETSLPTENETTGGYSGGIQLPFIPG